MYKVEFAPLNYYNNIMSQECLCVGILFHNLTTGERNFKPISNFKRFKAFNDELSPDFLKLYLSGIKEDVESNLFNDSRFSIKDYTKIYVNELRFENSNTVEFKEDEDYVDILSKIYLRFDYRKSDRLSKSQEKAYFTRIINSFNFELEKDKYVLGTYNENVKFDYIGGNLAIKTFSFAKKNLKKMIPITKQWAFSADELKNKYNIVFIYDEKIDNPDFDILMNILGKHAKVLSMADSIEYISSNANSYQPKLPL